jgi:uncharacterized protein YecT (DUF1311 family)
MPFPRLALLVALVLAASAAVAQTPAPGTIKSKTAVPKIDCTVATAPPELSHCAEIRLKKADSDLAAALDKARAQIAKRAAAAPHDQASWTKGLDDAHKAWTLYRVADCKGLVPNEWQGGTGAALAVLECMAQMTEQRSFELTERYAEGR